MIEAIDFAVDLALKGEAGAVVTAPINKAVLMQAGFGFPGHTDFLAKLTGAPRAVMMLASEQLRVVPLTIHIPLADVPRAVDQQSIVETAEIALAALKRDFGSPPAAGGGRPQPACRRRRRAGPRGRPRSSRPPSPS